MSTFLGKIVFELAGSNANIINNLIGHSVAIDKNCNKAVTGETSHIGVVGAEVVGGWSSLIAHLDASKIGDKFDDYAKFATKANSTFAILSVGVKVYNGEKLNEGDALTIIGAAAGLFLPQATVLIAGISIAGLAYTFYDLAKNGYPTCPQINPDPNYKKLPRSNKAHGYDPLILNLDGKGIQTIAPSSISARFDHNADGIATATGWTAAGNGILVLDLDNNGKIDSGKEIFGNHSVLSNGTTAAHGYAALAELDSNADGIISALDDAFSSLKVWQDINQDGIYAYFTLVRKHKFVKFPCEVKENFGKELDKVTA